MFSDAQTILFYINCMSLAVETAESQNICYILQKSFVKKSGLTG